MQKQVNFKIKGMQKDLSASAFNSEYAYENKNIRIMPTDESTLFSIVNEKGNKSTRIIGVDDYLVGTPVGQAQIDDELIVFTSGKTIINDISSGSSSLIDDIVGENKSINIVSNVDDRIYKLWFDDNTNRLFGTVLYSGQLDLDYKHPIETICFYENQEIKKVYWTDGFNQPRVINVAAASEAINKWNDTSFDFVRKLKLQETVTIDRNIIANGVFSPGVIQYAFTYFDKYGQESNIFYTSPLYYVSYNNRGASPEDKVGNSFNITVDNIDRNFDYVRIYSIHRTSIDAVPTVKRVVDLATIPYSRPTVYYMEKWKKRASAETIAVYDRIQKVYVPLSSIDPESTTGTVSKLWNLSGANYSSIQFQDGDYVDIKSSKSMYIYMVNKTSDVTINYTDNTELTVYMLSKSKVSYTDTGTSGDIIDPTQLLYVGGEEVVFGTMSQKDNVLFLGDITLKRKVINNTIKNALAKGTIRFAQSSVDSIAKYLIPPKSTGYYPYDNQLKYDSYKIKTFKYLEVYRFGVQFQHVSGKWSEPVWINDTMVTQHVNCSYVDDTINIYLPTAAFTLKNTKVINDLISQGYVRVRPVIVYPTLNDRECICQGVLCPTVFNVGDRYGNAPFVQSSWFTRPNAPFDEYKAIYYEQNSDGGYQKDWYDRDKGYAFYPSINSRMGVMSNSSIIDKHNGVSYDLDVSNRGAWAEFRHLYPIPSNNKRNAEIQCIVSPPATPAVSNTNTEAETNKWVSENNENFYIDQSIVTLHSPDIEFDDNLRNIDTSGLQLRIVGMVPLTSFAGDIDIQTSTLANNYKGSTELAPGFYKEPVGCENISRFGWRGLLSGAFWFDELSDYKNDKENTSKLATGFVVYPFHRNGSLNNTKTATEGYKSAMLDKKKLSNIRYSYNTYFFDSENIYNFYNEGSDSQTGISGISVFDSNEATLIRIPAQENSGLGDINYYGNVDKIINISRIGSKKDGYPIVTTGAQNINTNAHSLFKGDYIPLDNNFTNQTTGYDPVSMKYKSTPHAVVALNYTKNNYQRILPTIKDGDKYPSITKWDVNAITSIESGSHAFWDKNQVCKGILQDKLDIPINLKNPMDSYSIEYGWLWLGEIYNPNVINRFGGTTDEAFENNQWLPCGESVSLIDDYGTVKSEVDVVWTEGDTYYQRYDHIKTYPFTLEDQNAITDIVSFMCETRVNIDGRYDRNRGQTSNFVMTPTNFNLINDVYSQQNNFFTYRAFNSNKLNLDDFHNLITWTNVKTAGELTDTWTNITLANTLDLDGDKGNVRAIRRFNNSLFAFQDKGISKILYNENTVITTTEGAPIELNNSGRVSGKRYISDTIGCTNKWSLCTTPNGIYFIDDNTKGIFLFNDQLHNLSDKLGFHSWINSKSTDINIWNPVDFDGFVTYYDKVNGDVFFISKDECLAFSEPLGQFTSFYSYEHTPYFSNLKDRGIAINTTSGDTKYKVWLHNEGMYNMFFDKYQPFYTTVIANPDISVDKVFNNLEFRADTWNGSTLLDSTFDTLTTWNEYQTGVATLNNILGRPSELKKKFRVWRANIPRDSANGRDRMRNPWLYIKLSMETRNTNKTILHDMVVHYFE